jgi:uncharacterized OsmC-like protein
MRQPERPVATISSIHRINGVNVDELRSYIDSVEADATQADRHPVVVGRWVGGTRAEVTSSLGGPPVYMGGDDDPSAMGMLLRTLTACDIEVIVNRTALIGVQIEDLTIEARGYFNVKRYLGLETESDPGYQWIDYTIRLQTTPTLTADQAEMIRLACAHSPVSVTLERHVPVTLTLET